MKLRYYLRGLGIGIFVTTVVMSIIFGDNKQVLSDKEIVERAQELGMVKEEDSLFAQKESDTDLTIENKEKDMTTKEAEQTASDLTKDTASNQEDTIIQNNGNEETSGTDITTDNVGTEAAVLETGQNNSGSMKEYQISIAGGMSSDKVAQLLKNNGVIEDATAFNQYLVAKGYDKNIRIGKYTVNSQMEYEQIAKIITSK